jgi:hypothetical protein
METNSLLPPDQAERNVSGEEEVIVSPNDIVQNDNTKSRL